MTRSFSHLAVAATLSALVAQHEQQNPADSVNAAAQAVFESDLARALLGQLQKEKEPDTRMDMDMVMEAAALGAMMAECEDAEQRQALLDVLSMDAGRAGHATTGTQQLAAFLASQQAKEEIVKADAERKSDADAVVDELHALTPLPAAPAFLGRENSGPGLRLDPTELGFWVPPFLLSLHQAGGVKRYLAMLAA